MREAPDIITSSDDYARRFEGRAGDYFLRIQEKAIMAVLGRQDPGQQVLDLGGGHGQLAPLFVELGCQVTITGSSNACHTRLRQMSSIAENLQFVTVDLLKLPFSDKSFDIVVAVRLVSHLIDWPTFVSECCRVARQTVILDYPSRVSINALTPLLFRLKKAVEGNTRTYTSFFQKNLADEFAKFGFSVTARYPQFFLPMVIHRATKGATWAQIAELLCSNSGVTRLFGSPVILRLDRRALKCTRRGLPRHGKV